MQFVRVTATHNRNCLFIISIPSSDAVVDVDFVGLCVLRCAGPLQFCLRCLRCVQANYYVIGVKHFALTTVGVIVWFAVFCCRGCRCCTIVRCCRMLMTQWCVYRPIIRRMFLLLRLCCCSSLRVWMSWSQSSVVLPFVVCCSRLCFVTRWFCTLSSAVHVAMLCCVLFCDFTCVVAASLCRASSGVGREPCPTCRAPCLLFATQIVTQETQHEVVRVLAFHSLLLQTPLCMLPFVSCAA